MYRWETRMLLKHYLEQGVSQSELARRFGIDSTTFCRFSGRVRGRPIEESTASSTSEADSGTCQRGLEVNSETHVREPRTNGYPKVRLLVRIDRSGGRIYSCRHAWRTGHAGDQSESSSPWRQD